MIFQWSYRHLFVGTTREYIICCLNVSRDYTDKTMPRDMIGSHIKKNSESKRKKIILSFEQKSLLTEFHTYSFNVKLGTKVAYTSSTSSTTDLKSLALIKVWLKHPYFQFSICMNINLNLNTEFEYV